MFCFQCGHEIPAGSKFCVNCGAKLLEVPGRTAAPQPIPASVNPVDTSSCIFRLALPEKLNSFRMGGDDSGNVDIFPDRLELYKKSAGVAIAFGAIGSALEGKGTRFFTLSPAMVVRTEKQLNKKGAMRGYVFWLTDGRALRLHPTGKSNAEAWIDRIFAR